MSSPTDRVEVGPPACFESTQDSTTAAATVDNQKERSQLAKENPQSPSSLPRLNIPSYPRWVEIEDVKGKTQHLEEVITPARFAPEVIPMGYSDSAPQVLRQPDFAAEKLEVQEEKIVYNDDMIHISGGHRNSFDEKIIFAEDKSSSNTAEIPKPWYSSKQKRLLLLGAIIILACIAGVSLWIGVKKRRIRSRELINNGTINSMVSGMAATQWLDLEGQRHYRVFYQDQNNAILESAWESNATSWKASVVANPNLRVQNGSSLTAANGWPHANYTWTHVS
jgi:hypothetical protein